MEKILIIQPIDNTTSFLSPVIKKIVELFKKKVEIKIIEQNWESHKDCLDYLKASKDINVVIFFGHGGSSYLLGAQGQYADAFVSDDFAHEFPHLVYKHNHFIDIENIDVFSNKKVFCLSCNSNDDLAKAAIENNTLVFLGFGEIPTSIEEFKKIGLFVSDEVVEYFNKQLVDILCEMFSYIYRNQLITFNEIKSIIRYLTNRCLIGNVLRSDMLKDKKQFAYPLYYFKSGVKVYGDGEILFI